LRKGCAAHASHTSRAVYRRLEAKVPPSIIGRVASSMMSGAQVRLKLVCVVSRHRIGSPAKPSDCVVGAIVANGPESPGPRRDSHRKSANREPHPGRLFARKRLSAPHSPGHWRNQVRFASPWSWFEQQRKVAASTRAKRSSCLRSQ